MSAEEESDISLALRGGAGDTNEDDDNVGQEGIDSPEEDPGDGYDVRVDEGERCIGQDNDDNPSSLSHQTTTWQGGPVAEESETRTRKYRVRKCSVYVSWNNFKGHLQSVHGYRFECPEAACDYVGRTKLALYEHRTRNHGETIKCLIEGCSWQGTKYRLTHDHEQTHDPKYKCPEQDCGYIGIPWYLVTHMRRQHKRTDFAVQMAGECGKVDQVNSEGSNGGISDGEDDLHAVDVYLRGAGWEDDSKEEIYSHARRMSWEPRPCPSSIFSRNRMGPARDFNRSLMRSSEFLSGCFYYKGTHSDIENHGTMRGLEAEPTPNLSAWKELQTTPQGGLTDQVEGLHDNNADQAGICLRGGSGRNTSSLVCDVCSPPVTFPSNQQSALESHMLEHHPHEADRLAFKVDSENCPLRGCTYRGHSQFMIQHLQSHLQTEVQESGRQAIIDAISRRELLCQAQQASTRGGRATKAKPKGEATQAYELAQTEQAQHDAECKKAYADALTQVLREYNDPLGWAPSDVQIRELERLRAEVGPERLAMVRAMAEFLYQSSQKARAQGQSVAQARPLALARPLAQGPAYIQPQMAQTCNPAQAQLLHQAPAFHQAQAHAFKLSLPQNQAQSLAQTQAYNQARTSNPAQAYSQAQAQAQGQAFIQAQAQAQACNQPQAQFQLHNLHLTPSQAQVYNQSQSGKFLISNNQAPQVPITTTKVRIWPQFQAQAAPSNHQVYPGQAAQDLHNSGVPDQEQGPEAQGQDPVEDHDDNADHIMTMDEFPTKVHLPVDPQLQVQPQVQTPTELTINPQLQVQALPQTTHNLAEVAYYQPSNNVFDSTWEVAGIAEDLGGAATQDGTGNGDVAMDLGNNDNAVSDSTFHGPSPNFADAGQGQVHTRQYQPTTRADFTWPMADTDPGTTTSSTSWDTTMTGVLSVAEPTNPIS